MPQWHEAMVRTSRPVGPDLVELALEVPPAVASRFHAPGQYHRLRVEGAGDAFFAIASPPDATAFEYLIKRTGQTAAAIAALPVGGRLEVSDVEGQGFPLGQAEGTNVLLVGTGTGFAPLRSVLHAVHRNREAFGDVRATWGITSPSHLAWAHEAERWAQARIGFEPVAFGAADGWSGRVGVVQDVIAQWPVERAVAFLCGHADMVRDVTALLVARGLPADRVFLNY